MPAIVLSHIETPEEITFECQNGQKGFLNKISEGMTRDQTLLELMSQWRNENARYFLDQSTSTPETTKAYLQNVFKKPDHTLYLLHTEGKVVVGHLGYFKISNELVELDNLVRSKHSLPTDFISMAERALILEIFKLQDIENIQLKVLARNILAKRIHISLGFELTESKEMIRVTNSHGRSSLIARSEQGNVDEILQTLALSKSKWTLTAQEKGTENQPFL
jgi:hypothetical protein